MSQNAEKTEREDPLGFSASILSQNSKKMKGALWWKKNSKKVAQSRKKLKGTL